jgi:hypothetical protein
LHIGASAAKPLTTIIYNSRERGLATEAPITYSRKIFLYWNYHIIMKSWCQILISSMPHAVHNNQIHCYLLVVNPSKICAIFVFVFVYWTASGWRDNYGKEFYFGYAQSLFMLKILTLIITVSGFSKASGLSRAATTLLTAFRVIRWSRWHVTLSSLARAFTPALKSSLWTE